MKMEDHITDGPSQDDPIGLPEPREFDPELDKTPLEELKRIDVMPDSLAGCADEIEAQRERLKKCRMAQEQAE